MSDLTLILLAAGDATRFKKPVKKQWLRIGSDPLWLFVAKKFEKMGLFKKIIITSHPDEYSYMQSFGNYTFIKGASSRQGSLQNALDIVETDLVLVSDVARSCVDITICNRLLEGLKDADCVVPTLPISDTVYYDGKPIDRKKIHKIQTPQLSKTEILKKALSQNRVFTDESSAIFNINGKVAFINGDRTLHKLTFLEDLAHLQCLKKPDTSIHFIGNGFDVHAFEDKKPMYLGGVLIDSTFGFKAHSDGDVAIHALIDALLGAAGMGDIGELFPDTDKSYEGIDSKELLKRVVKKIHNVGFEVVNTDITIIAQIPKLSPYKARMAKTLANILQISNERVNIKATTTEKLGFIGRKEGVAVMTTATLKFFDWTQL